MNVSPILIKNQRVCVTVLLSTLAACGAEQQVDAVATSQPRVVVSQTAAASVVANQPSSPQHDENIVVQQALAIFDSGCLNSGGKEENVAVWAKERGLLELDNAQKQSFYFESEVNRAWGAHTREGGQFFLAVGQGYCTVKVRTVDTATLRQEFGAWVEQTAQKWNLPAERVKNALVEQGVHQTAYWVRDKQTQTDLMLSLLTTEKVDAGAQAALIVRAVVGAAAQ